MRTPEGNLSHAIRWLNVTYSMRFNGAHRQRGHVFQGRFKGLIIEGRDGAAEVARYVPLNPVRISGLGLGKVDQRRAAVLGCEDPGNELVTRRLERRVRPEWPSRVKAAEAELGRPWKTLVEAHGDWGRDGVLVVEVRYGRHQLAQAANRFATAVEHDASRSRFLTRLGLICHMFRRDPIAHGQENRSLN